MHILHLIGKTAILHNRVLKASTIQTTSRAPTMGLLTKRTEIIKDSHTKGLSKRIGAGITNNLQTEDIRDQEHRLTLATLQEAEAISRTFNGLPAVEAVVGANQIRHRHLPYSIILCTTSSLFPLKMTIHFVLLKTYKLKTRAARKRTCLLPASKLLAKRAPNSALPSNQKLRLLLPRNLYQIWRRRCGIRLEKGIFQTIQGRRNLHRQESLRYLDHARTTESLDTIGLRTVGIVNTGTNLSTGTNMMIDTTTTITTSPDIETRGGLSGSPSPIQKGSQSESTVVNDRLK